MFLEAQKKEGVFWHYIIFALQGPDGIDLTYSLQFVDQHGQTADFCKESSGGGGNSTGVTVAVVLVSLAIVGLIVLAVFYVYKTKGYVSHSSSYIDNFFAEEKILTAKRKDLLGGFLHPSVICVCESSQLKVCSGNAFLNSIY